MKKLLVIAMAMAAAITAGAQPDPDYRAEIRGGGGLRPYQGDFPGSRRANTQQAGGLDGN